MTRWLRWRDNVGVLLEALPDALVAVIIAKVALGHVSAPDFLVLAAVLVARAFREALAQDSAEKALNRADNAVQKQGAERLYVELEAKHRKLDDKVTMIDNRTKPLAQRT